MTAHKELSNDNSPCVHNLSVPLSERILDLEPVPSGIMRHQVARVLATVNPIHQLERHSASARNRNPQAEEIRIIIPVPGPNTVPIGPHHLTLLRHANLVRLAPERVPCAAETSAFKLEFLAREDTRVVPVRVCFVVDLLAVLSNEREAGDEDVLA